MAKVFAMASDLISIDDNVLCSALQWLVLRKQLQNGSFKEDAAVHQREMMVRSRLNLKSSVEEKLQWHKKNHILYFY